jgi:SHS2 domain-containing protein
MGYQKLDHTADTGIELQARSLDELFADAAIAFGDCVTEVAGLRCRQWRTFEIEARDLETLLVDWLDELLFAFETDGLLFGRVEVEVEEAGVDWRLRAKAGGECFDPLRHPLKVPIKAITYHRLKVGREAGGWIGRVIFDV